MMTVLWEAVWTSVEGVEGVYEGPEGPMLL
jgi:hypothetical protein